MVVSHDPDPHVFAGARLGIRGDRTTQPLAVLLVEDDARIQFALGLALEGEGFHVRSEASEERALAVLADDEAHVDLVVLDLMLSETGGADLCRRIRGTSTVPVIVVTTRSSNTDIVAGLEAGADDYVTKPVDLAVLAARIRAVARRANPEIREQMSARAGNVALDVARGVVRVNDRVVHTTRTEFLLLQTLVAARGRVVSRQQLLHQVWGHTYSGDTRLLDVHIRRLRRKVERDPANPSLVITVRGVGYRVCA